MILSIDVGIKNLAICLLDSTTIHKWQIINLNYGTDFCTAIIHAFDELLPILQNATVVIERQMTRKMTNIQCYLEMYFRLKGYSVIIYSPKYKLQGTGQENSGKGKTLYNARKKASISLCQDWLIQYPQEEDIMSQWKTAKKRDDLGDTLAMAIAYLANPKVDQAIAKPVNARKPTALQESKGRYSKSNIKYLLQQDVPITAKINKAILKFWSSLETCKLDLSL